MSARSLGGARVAADARLFLAAYSTVWLLTALAAIACATVAPLRTIAREQIGTGLRLYPHAHASIGLALATFVHNARIAGWPLLVARLGFQRARWQRQLAAGLLGASLAANTAIVGAAVAVAGPAIVPYLIHLPLEWAALALAATGWLLTATGAVGRRQLRTLSCWFLILLAAAAGVETYAVPHL